MALTQVVEKRTAAQNELTDLLALVASPESTEGAVATAIGSTGTAFGEQAVAVTTARADEANALLEDSAFYEGYEDFNPLDIAALQNALINGPVTTEA